MKDCAIVKDILPLYIEDMVSEETKLFINEHLKECEDCRNELDILKSEALVSTPEIISENEIKPFRKAAKKLNRQLYGFSYMLIILFILLGFSYTEEEKMMYNSLIMPLVGVFGYTTFKWRVIYKLPVLLVGVNLFAMVFDILNVDQTSAVIWTLIYMLFAFIGSLIAYLLHFAFRKEK